MSSAAKASVGKIFTIPLFEGGFAFGYITYIDKATIKLCNVFDRISEKNVIPHNIEKESLAVTDFPFGGAEFNKQKKFPDKQWILSNRAMPESVRASQSLFIMGTSPLFLITDIYKPEMKRRATSEEVEKYPSMSVYFPPFTTKQIEVRVRHLDIDPKLIGTPRGVSAP